MEGRRFEGRKDGRTGVRLEGVDQIYDSGELGCENLHWWGLPLPIKCWPEERIVVSTYNCLPITLHRAIRTHYPLNDSMYL